ncbi:MAG: response regulator transcription factor [Spirochaetales bacterium]|nr:response regulator transcription factor [Spirochaetales bacterium]
MNTKQLDGLIRYAGWSIYVIVLLELLHLFINKSDSLLQWTIIFTAYIIILPVGKGKLFKYSLLLFSMIFIDGLLLTLGVFWLGDPGGISFMYLILILLCPRLPRKYSILAYLCLYLFIFMPIIWTGLKTGDYKIQLLEGIPGILAFTVFAELYWYLRRVLKQKDKLMETLIETQRKTQQEADFNAEISKFSRRDLEVLELIAIGYSNKEIADSLCLAEGTVKNRVSSILHKMELRDRTQAALRARELGLL